MRSLRRYLILAFLGLAAVPLLIQGSLLSWYGFELQRGNEYRYEQVRAEHVAFMVRHLFETFEERVRTLDRFEDFQALPLRRQRDLVLELLAREPAFREVALITASGEEKLRLSTVEVFASDASPEWSTRPEFTLPLETRRIYYSPVFTDESTGEPLMRMALPQVSRRTREVEAVFVLELQLRDHLHLLEQPRTSGREQIYITDTRNRVIIHRDPSHVLADRRFKPLATTGIQKGLAGNSVVISVETVRLGDESLNIIAEQDAGSALAPARKSVFITLALLVLSLCFAGALVALAIRLIVEPLQRLSDTARAIADGNLKTRAEASGVLEISELARSFNSMTSRLLDSMDELEEEIRERMLVETDLRKSRGRLAFHLENTPVASIVWDPDFKVTEWNPAAEKIFGFSKEEALGGDVFSLIVPEYMAAEVGEVCRLLLDGTGGFFSVNENLTRGGETIVCEWHNTPLVDERGEVEAVASLVLDITRPVTQQKELKRLRKFLGNIIDSMPSILIGVDAGGLITQWNRQAESVTGIGAAEACGKKIEETFPLLAGEMERVRRAMKSRRPQERHRVAFEQEGQTRYSNITIYPLTDEQPHGAVIRVDDITALVEMEAAMVQSEKMLSLGGVAAGIAHEINNPLAGILQSSQVIENRLREDLPKNERAAEELGMSMPEIRRYLENRHIPELLKSIADSGRHAAQIVENLLSFSRKGSGDKTPEDIGLLLDQALELAAIDHHLTTRCRFKEITILRWQRDPVPRVPCEPSQIQQVILNILRNGAQAMQASATASPCFTFSFERGEGMVLLNIGDNGPGMDEATRQRIFEPFFTTKATGEGTGLGLSLCYFIITESHGGTFTVDSAPGQGTTFSIGLPLDAGPAAN